LESEKQIDSRIVHPSGPFVGIVRPPGDKSISHRALILNSMSMGHARITGILKSHDVLSTMKILINLGVRIEESSSGVINIWGTNRFLQPMDQLDCGNSGTTMRLMLGLLSTYPIKSTLIGDVSLSKRPMKRITSYLRDFGVSCEGENDANHAPITLTGTEDIPAFEIRLPVASAQVKSALSLIALRSNGGIIRGGMESRDHTERMINAMGGSCVSLGGGDIEVKPGKLRALDMTIPGDFSSASFMIVAALITPDSSLEIRNVNINQTRIGLLKTLLDMGADIALVKERIVGTEPVADIRVSYSKLVGVVVPKERIVSMIDEIPIFAVAASQAIGRTIVTGALELRNKESDRLNSIQKMLEALDGSIKLFEDGFVIDGSQKLTGGVVKSAGDHRIAMSAAVAAAVATGNTKINDISCVDTSFPNFWTTLSEVGLESSKL
jgi:3-phosphoshikimate 1-carboxyvinyltransferase